jgi:hypothetical protein
LAAYTLAGIVASRATLGQLELTPGRRLDLTVWDDTLRPVLKFEVEAARIALSLGKWMPDRRRQAC